MDRPDPTAQPPNPGRRRFLILTGGLGLAWTGAMMYPVFRFLSPLPVPDLFGPEGRAPVDRVTPAQVARPGQGGNGAYGGRGVVLFRGADGQLRAFDAKCTHAGCNVQFAGDSIVCHCHNGVYDLDGRNVSGPPPRPLTPLRVIEEDGQLFVAPETAPPTS